MALAVAVALAGMDVIVCLMLLDGCLKSYFDDGRGVVLK